MTTELTITEQWYLNLIEECKDTIVEMEFASRWALVEGYHLLGKRILSECENFQRIRMEDTNLVNSVAKSLGKSKWTLNYAIQFAKKYPDLALLPEAKNISWYHIINKYLTTGEKKPTITKGKLVKQLEEIRKLLEREWLIERQDFVDVPIGVCDIHKIRCIYIRYLQDKIEKICERKETYTG